MKNEAKLTLKIGRMYGEAFCGSVKKYRSLNEVRMSKKEKQ